MTNEEFARSVLSKVKDEPFKPMVIYNQDDDSLEVLISNEGHRTTKTECPFLKLHVGRDSGDVAGVLILGISKLIKDMEDGPPDVRLEVHNGKFKVVHLVRAIREKSKKQNMTIGILIKSVEEAADKFDLEANIGNCVSA